MERFNDLADFSIEELRALLELAEKLEREPEPRALQGKVLALLFLSPSLRTLTSFQSAMVRLGGSSFVVSPEMSIHGLEYRNGIVMDGAAAEHIREAVPVIASYGHAMGIRVFAERHSLEQDLADRQFRELAALVDVPLINMESAVNHPCQSLADWKTLDELRIPGNGGRFQHPGQHARSSHLPLHRPLETHGDSRCGGWWEQVRPEPMGSGLFQPPA